MRCVVWCIQNWRSSASCALENRLVSSAKTWPRCCADRRGDPLAPKKTAREAVLSPNIMGCKASAIIEG
jgi:hypothetical protein